MICLIWLISLEKLIMDESLDRKVPVKFWKSSYYACVTVTSLNSVIWCWPGLLRGSAGNLAESSLPLGTSRL